MTLARSTVALLAMLVAASLVNGCSGPAAEAGSTTGGTGAGAPVASSSAVPQGQDGEATATAGSPGTGSSSKSLSARELARIRAQLDAMQKEIDTLEMPTDDDFNSAASDLY